MVRPWYTRSVLLSFCVRNEGDAGLLDPLIGVRIPAPEPLSAEYRRPVLGLLLSVHSSTMHAPADGHGFVDSRNSSQIPAPEPLSSHAAAEHGDRARRGTARFLDGRDLRRVVTARGGDVRVEGRG